MACPMPLVPPVTRTVVPAKSKESRFVIGPWSMVIMTFPQSFDPSRRPRPCPNSSSGRVWVTSARQVAPVEQLDGVLEAGRVLEGAADGELLHEDLDVVGRHRSVVQRRPATCGRRPDRARGSSPMTSVRTRRLDVDVGRRRRPEHEGRGAVQPGQLGPDVVLGRIEQVGGAELPRQLEAAPAQVDGHHVGDAPVGQGGDGQQADRPAAEDGHRVAGPRPRPGSPPACSPPWARPARRPGAACRRAREQAARPWPPRAPGAAGSAHPRRPRCPAAPAPRRRVDDDAVADGASRSPRRRPTRRRRPSRGRAPWAAR